MKQKDNSHKMLGIFLRGLAMGVVNIVPGVSAGTIAFITGIYPRLLSGINQITEVTRAIIKSPKNCYESLKTIDWKFFVPLAAGITISLLLFSGVMSFFLSSYPANTFAFFAGLIFASAYMMYKTLENINLARGMAFIFGLIAAHVISGLSALNFSNSAIVVFLSIIVAVCATLLPGISGAFVLILLGQYEYLVTMIHERNLFIITIIAAGVITGLVLFSKFVDTLMKKHKNITLYALTGIMLGALRVPYLEIANNGGFQAPIYVLYFIILGAAIVFVVDYVAKQLKK